MDEERGKKSNNKKIITNTFYFLLIVAIIIAAYLTFAHYSPSVLLCPDTGIINCNSVITSRFSTIFGIPISLLAILFFLSAFFIIKKMNSSLVFIWSIIGVGAVLYSIGGMFILEEYCIYCSLLDVIILLLVFLINRISSTKFY